MKRPHLRPCIIYWSTILVTSFGAAQPLPVDLAGNVAGVLPGVRLTQLINMDLKSPAGESLGQVQDLILDPVTGQVQFAILSTGPGGHSGIGSPTPAAPGTASRRSVTTRAGSFVAIPWRLVSSSGQGQYVANVDRARLQGAPAFSSGSWPTFDANWMHGVNSHFGLSGTSTGRPGNNSNTGSGIENRSEPGTPRTPATGPGQSRPGPGATPKGGTATGAGSAVSGGAGSGSGK